MSDAALHPPAADRAAVRSWLTLAVVVAARFLLMTLFMQDVPGFRGRRCRRSGGRRGLLRGRRGAEGVGAGLLLLAALTAATAALLALDESGSGIAAPRQGRLFGGAAA